MSLNKEPHDCSEVMEAAWKEAMDTIARAFAIEEDRAVMAYFEQRHGMSEETMLETLGDIATLIVEETEDGNEIE